MEEKKFDAKTIIGFVLIFFLLLWVMQNNKPTEEELAKRKAAQEQAEAQAKQPENTTPAAEPFQQIPTDSVALAQYKTTLGAFAYSASLPSAKPCT